MLPAFCKKQPYTDTIAQAASNTLSSPLKSEVLPVQPSNHPVVWRELWHCAILMQQTEMKHYQNGPSGREAVSHAKEGLFLSFYSCSSGEQ